MKYAGFVMVYDFRKRLDSILTEETCEEIFEEIKGLEKVFYHSPEYKNSAISEYDAISRFLDRKIKEKEEK